MRSSTRLLSDETLTTQPERALLGLGGEQDVGGEHVLHAASRAASLSPVPRAKVSMITHVSPAGGGTVVNPGGRWRSLARRATASLRFRSWVVSGSVRLWPAVASTRAEAISVNVRRFGLRSRHERIVPGGTFQAVAARRREGARRRDSVAGKREGEDASVVRFPARAAVSQRTVAVVESRRSCSPHRSPCAGSSTEPPSRAGRDARPDPRRRRSSRPRRGSSRRGAPSSRRRGRRSSVSPFDADRLGRATGGSCRAAIAEPGGGVLRVESLSAPR